jgi:DNA-binding MarR family transcriptional regulator
MKKQSASLGRNMSIINKYLKIFLKNKFSEIGLSSAEVMILLTINGSDGISQEGVLEHLGYDKAVIARRTKQLLDAGYISRRRSSEDKRLYQLRLNTKGQEMMPLIFKSLIEWNELITVDIPAEAVDLVVENIEKIAQNAIAAQNGE